MQRRDVAVAAGARHSGRQAAAVGWLRLLLLLAGAVVLGVLLGNYAGNVPISQTAWEAVGGRRSSSSSSSGSSNKSSGSKAPADEDAAQADRQAAQAISQLREAIEAEEKRTQSLKQQLADHSSSSSGSSAAATAATAAAAEEMRRRLTGKAGPPGTVKNVQTNLPLVPNRHANPELAAVLESVVGPSGAKELLVGISSIHIRDMLLMWIEQVQRVGITNYLVLALDEETEELCKKQLAPVYRRVAKLGPDGKQVELDNNHAVSGTKFALLRDFLVLGYSVLLSDIDIVWLRNPFEGNLLQRDSDIEGMTDGFNNATAYGWDDIWYPEDSEPDREDGGSGGDSPSPKMLEDTVGIVRLRHQMVRPQRRQRQSKPDMRGAIHTMRIFVFNSGLFYVRPTVPSLNLLDRVAARLRADKEAWDQAVYNEQMFFPSSPDRDAPNGGEGLHISRRVLDFLLFMNSKTLFKRLRKQPGRMKAVRPVSVHVNYHPDKEERMAALIQYYVRGDEHALDRFPDGSE